MIDYQGDSSAQALSDILQLVPVDIPPTRVRAEIVVMMPDPPEVTCDATKAFEGVAGDLDVAYASRLDTDTFPGFYSQANNPERPTIFFRTRDEKAYACAMFVVGHSQE